MDYDSPIKLPDSRIGLPLIDHKHLKSNYISAWYGYFDLDHRNKLFTYNVIVENTKINYSSECVRLWVSRPRFKMIRSSLIIGQMS